VAARLAHINGIDCVQGVTLNGKFQTLTRLAEVVFVRSRLIDPRNPAITPTSRHRARLGGQLTRGVIPPHRPRVFRSLTPGPSPFSSMKITPTASSAAFAIRRTAKRVRKFSDK
jgi:hypothetical protein